MNYSEVKESQHLKIFIVVMLILSLFFLFMTACTVRIGHCDLPCVCLIFMMTSVDL